MAAYRKVPIVSLETDRLRLRPLQESDAPKIQAQFPHPNVLRYMAATIPWPYPDDGAIQFVRRMLPKIAACEEYYWAIVLKGREDEGLIGVISLSPASDEDNRGFWLAEAYWGRGLMREAATAVNDFAFDTLGMEAMLLNNAQPNGASHRLKASAGAELLSVEETEYVGGTFPGVHWRLTAEAWRDSKAHALTARKVSGDRPS